MTGRQGEAHLWLLLEEALDAARQARAADPTAWEARRSFRYVADTLVAVGAVPRPAAAAIVAELDDALVLRGYLETSAFTGAAFPDVCDVTPQPGGAGDPGVWLEAEIHRHIDLLAGFAAGDRGEAGRDALRILGAPVRALTAVFGTREPHDLLAELASSLCAAGFSVDERPTPARPAWVRYLRSAPPALADDEPFDVVRQLAVPLDEDGRVVVEQVAWSRRAIAVVVAADADTPRPDAGAWLARARDESGCLHLGQAGTVAERGRVCFLLRHGLARRGPLHLTLARGGVRFDGAVPA